MTLCDSVTFHPQLSETFDAQLRSLVSICLAIITQHHSPFDNLIRFPIQAADSDWMDIGFRKLLRGS